MANNPEHSKSPDIEFVGFNPSYIAKKAQTLPTKKPTTQTNTSKLSNLNDEEANIERKCENPDCTAPTLISLVPTKLTSQFVQNPYVIPNPILVNGYTTVFQIDGQPAKVKEIPGQTSDGKIRFQTDSPIYRITPNTHAHIVNYVIVDPEGVTLQKIKNNDPASVKRLLQSQTNSAEQLLKKLMGLKKVEGKITQPTQPTSSQSTAANNSPTSKFRTIMPKVNSNPSTILSSTPTINTIPNMTPGQPILQSILPRSPQSSSLSTIPTVAAVAAGATTSPLSTIQKRFTLPVQTGSTTMISNQPRSSQQTNNPSLIITQGIDGQTILSGTIPVQSLQTPSVPTPIATIPVQNLQTPSVPAPVLMNPTLSISNQTSGAANM